VRVSRFHGCCILGNSRLRSERCRRAASPPAVVRDIPDLFSWPFAGGSKDNFATILPYFSHILAFYTRRMRLEGF
jgi:hypothetical protein